MSQQQRATSARAQAAPAQPRVSKRVEPRRPEQVTVDLRVQRPLDQRRVKKLMEGWSDLAMGVPTVSQREGGTCVALDGQHRWVALEQLGRGRETFPTMVYRGLTLDEEAKIFRLLNDVKRLSPVELFLVAVVEGEEVAVACNRILIKMGLTAERGRSNSFQAVNTLREKYERDQMSVERALLTAIGSWGIRRHALDGRLFAALSDVFFRYKDSVNLDQLVERLRKGADTSPDMLLGRGRSNATIRSISVHDAMADVIVNVYNAGRRTKTLPNWE